MINSGKLSELQQNASHGLKVYKKILVKFGLPFKFLNYRIFVFPDIDNEWLNLCLKHLNESRLNKKQKIFVICTQASELYFQNNLEIHDWLSISSEDMQHLIQTYKLYNFDPLLEFVSLDVFEDRYSDTLINATTITDEDILCNGIYCIGINETILKKQKKERIQKFSTKKQRMIFSIKNWANGFKWWILILCYLILKRIILLLISANNVVKLYSKLFLKNGEEKLQELSSKYKECKICLALYKGTGDVYLAASRIDEFMAKQHKKYVVCVIGNGNKKICNLFSLKNLEVVTEKEMLSMQRFATFYGVKDLNIKFLHHDFFKQQTGILDRLRNVKGINFRQLFEGGVFGSYSNSRIKTIFSESVDLSKIPEFKEGKSVLISPYSNTLKGIKRKFWEEIASFLKLNGFSVYTNVSSKKEKCIRGTLPLCLKYSELEYFLKHAGFFLGIRSGLCEVVAGAECNKMILYFDGTVWNNGDSFDYFSLNKMHLCENAEELNLSSCSLNESIKKIKNILGKQWLGVS